MNREKHYRFSLELLKLLHIDSIDFYTRVVNTERYDVQLFIWIDYCYATEQTISQSYAYIFKQRRVVFLADDALSDEDKKQLTAPDISLKQYELISYALSRLQEYKDLPPIAS